MAARRRDLDPKKAPWKSGQDLFIQLQDYCRTRVNDGFTLQECYFFSRANNKTISRLVRSCYEKGHLRKEGRRYFPEGSLFLCMYTDVEPEPEVTCGVVLCKSARCQHVNGREFCWRHVCTICGPSHTHYATREEAEEALERRNYHQDRLSHSHAPSKVRT